MPGIIYHVNDISIYLGRQTGGGIIEHISWMRSSFLTKSGTLFASQTFKTPALGAETTRSSL